MKTSNLTGAALDWAAHKALHGVCEGYAEHAYSTDWAQAGPLIEREGIELSIDKSHNMWRAFMTNEGVGYEYWGPTPLIAAMRCYVASREVQVRAL